MSHLTKGRSVCKVMLVTSKMLTPKQFHTFGKKMFKQRRNDLRRMSDTFKDISHEEKKTKKLARQSVRWRRSTINARRRKVRAKAKSQLGRFVGWKSSVCGGTNPTCGRSTSPLWSDTPWRVTPVYAFHRYIQVPNTRLVKIVL